jgi:hypothetical protein
MARTLALAIVASLAAARLGACGDDSDGYSYGGGGYSGGDSCQAYTSCGSCTPVSGCGWCFNETGGMCASSPDECSNVTEFTWTWDQSGCPDLDASVVVEAGHPSPPPPEADAGAPEASAADVGAPSSDASSATDAPADVVAQ